MNYCLKLINAFIIVILWNISCVGQNIPDTNYNHPYELISKAYSELNASAATALFLKNADLLNLYDNALPVSFKGELEIKKYFSDFFNTFISKKQALKLSIKIAERKKYDDCVSDNGYYRLEVVSNNTPGKMYFGKFSSILEFSEGEWKIRTDVNTNADFIEFENSNVPIIPKQDEVLFSDFYDELLGDYITGDNQIIVIGRSQTRLYSYSEANQHYRGLKKITPYIWTAGSTVISDSINQKFVFTDSGLEIYDGDKLVNKLLRKQYYKTEKINYSNRSGINLGGTLFIPNNPSDKAIVLIHGSGAQDRNGYASIIRLLADIFAREGITVLAYDKQGVGSSSGNWEGQSFTQLAEDALSGIKYLKERKDFNLTKIGLGGSSQAGWIIAKAIELSKEVDFALTIGAAGSSISVIEQNLFNTKIQMECNGNFSKKQIDNALTQQNYFFEYILHQQNANQLDEFTKTLANDSLLQDWLFPTSIQIDFNNRMNWFTALEINFDPIEIWKNYNKPVLMAFSEFDDQTPTIIEINNLEKLNKTNIKTIVFSNAQHIGLVTDSVCNVDLSNLQMFHKDFFFKLKEWLKKI